ncbi:MAG: hypothetical protein K2N94_06050, partial [Lachnospiraceae bacterium]|nr:hypothetical protein [Lachnospiraceae bacterium]
MEKDRRTFSVYVHIPFCAKKCDYCDFLSAPALAEVQERYVQALIKEIRAEEAADEDGRPGVGGEVVSVFFGGGTPSILRAGLIEEVLS